MRYRHCLGLESGEGDRHKVPLLALLGLARRCYEDSYEGDEDHKKEPGEEHSQNNVCFVMGILQ